MSQNILIVEDHFQVVEEVRTLVERIGFTLDDAHDAATGLEKAQCGEYCLIILDIGLPGADGFEVCREIRARDKKTPVLMLTGRTDDVDLVVGLELGADDFLTKPFNARELEARVKALIRRGKMSAEAENAIASQGRLCFGDLEIDTKRRGVELAGREIVLTRSEYNILLLLVSEPGRTFTKNQIISQMYDSDEAEVYEENVKSHISRLRAKLEVDTQAPKLIRTSWGVGYYFAPPDNDSEEK